MILSKGLTRLGGVVALAALLLGLGLASVPSAHAQAPMTLYGPAESAESVIGVLVDGAECKTAAVEATSDSATGYLWQATIGDDECEVSAGSEVSFTVDGNAATETVSWSPGGTPDDVFIGITLTVADMGEGEMGGGETGGEMGNGDMKPQPEPPDTGNAGLAATSSSSHTLALGLGVLAVAMLAGGRSVTGRSR